MANWIYYPNYEIIPNFGLDIIDAFNKVEKKINSENGSTLTSNQILEFTRPGLEKLNFSVETGKKKGETIIVPVLMGENGKFLKHFLADGIHKDNKWVLEVEAGRAFTNNQFLKDIFQASMMTNVDYLALAVRNLYRKSRDYEKIKVFLDTMYTSNRISLSLKGILLLGY
jgi:hypothetical protein